MVRARVAARAAYHLSATGESLFDKNATFDQPPASLVKIMTFVVAREYVTDSDINDTVTVTQGDIRTGSTAGLQVGDILSWDALFHGMMLPSGNDAAWCVARNVGAILPGGGDAVARFVARMNEVGADILSPGAVFTVPHGGDSGLNARHVCEMLLALDPYAVAVSGTQQYVATIAGPNARTVTYTHTVNPNGAVAFPEFLAGKSGTLIGAQVANVAMLWADDSGDRHAVSVIKSWPQAQRFVDARTIIDYVESGGTHGGVGVPFTIDGVHVSGTLEIENRGSAPSPAVIHINGPAQRPRVTHINTRSELVFDLILDAGQWLEVDLDARTVMLNGQASRRGRMRGNWFELTPGQNTLAFNALNDSPEAQLTVLWRDSYR